MEHFLSVSLYLSLSHHLLCFVLLSVFVVLLKALSHRFCCPLALSHTEGFVGALIV
jgi:hypothetical protein